MNTREYLTKINKTLHSYNAANGKSTRSPECARLGDNIFNVAEAVYTAPQEDLSRVKANIKIKIAETQLNPKNQKHHKLLAKGLGYLEFYSHCPVEYLALSHADKKAEDKLFNDKFDKSGWSKYFNTSKLTKNQTTCLKHFLMQKEMGIAYNKVLQQTNCGHLCLNPVNDNSLSLALNSPNLCRLNLCGPVSETENKYVPNHKSYKVRGVQGKYTEANIKQFIENNKRTIGFYNTTIKMYNDMKSIKFFKGMFYKYKQAEIAHFANQQILNARRMIAALEQNMARLQTKVRSQTQTQNYGRSR